MSSVRTRPLSRSSLPRRLGLLELEAHPAQDLRCLRELDVLVGDDLHWLPHGSRNELPPKISTPASRAAASTASRSSTTRPKWRCASGCLRSSLGEREELVAHVDERHPADPAAQLEVEEAAVEASASSSEPTSSATWLIPTGAGHAGAYSAAFSAARSTSVCSTFNWIFGESWEGAAETRTRGGRSSRTGRRGRHRRVEPRPRRDERHLAEELARLQMLRPAALLAFTVHLAVE